MFGINLFGAKKMVSVLRGASDKLFKAIEDKLFDAAISVRNEMREEGKPVVYPIQWDSTKQRKAFFATNGFGRGIPTKRTGKSNAAWSVIRMENGSQVMNPLSHIQFINGRRQSRIHRGRWKVLYTVVSKIWATLPADIQTRARAVFKEQGIDAQ